MVNLVVQIVKLFTSRYTKSLSVRDVWSNLHWAEIVVPHSTSAKSISISSIQQTNLNRTLVLDHASYLSWSGSVPFGGVDGLLRLSKKLPCLQSMLTPNHIVTCISLLFDNHKTHRIIHVLLLCFEPSLAGDLVYKCPICVYLTRNHRCCKCEDRNTIGYFQWKIYTFRPRMFLTERSY